METGHIGAIFALMSFFQIITQLLIGQYIHLININKSSLLYLGEMMIFFQVSTLGSLPYTDGTLHFYYQSIFA
jgi:MFS family permease